MKKLKFLIISLILLITTSSIFILLYNIPSQAANTEKDNFIDAVYNGEHMDTPAGDIAGTTFPMEGNKYSMMQDAECRRGVCLNHNQGDGGGSNRFSVIESVIEVNSEGEVTIYNSDGTAVPVTGSDAEVFNTMACIAEQHTAHWEEKMNGAYPDEEDAETYGIQHPGCYLADHREVLSGKYGLEVSNFNIIENEHAYDESEVNSRNRIRPGKTMRFYIITDWRREKDGTLTQVSQERMWWEDNGEQPRIFTKQGDGGNPLEDFQFDWQELSIRAEYADDYPEFFDPSNDMYQDPVGDVDYWRGDDHCKINLAPDDSIYVSKYDWRDRFDHYEYVPYSYTDDEGNEHKGTRQEAVYAPKWVPVEWTCTTHNDVFGEYSEGEANAHVSAYNTKKANTEQQIYNKIEKFHEKREKGVAQVKQTPYTDESGEIDISPLCPAGDDYLGIIQQREITVNWNPYYNNDHPGFENITYWENVTWTDKRRRMDIEGYIWEDVPAQGKEGTDREITDGVYGGGDSLLSPVIVELKLGGSTIGEGVVTQNGMYRIRVGGYDGKNLDLMMANKDACYLEFTYNGLKYQSVFPAWPSSESIALENSGDRAAFNNKFTTIVSDSGAPNSNNVPTGNTQIKFDKNGEYKRKINYEGPEALGDGGYSVTNKVPAASEIDKVTPTEQIAPHKYDRSPCASNCYSISSRTPTNATKYQISATTMETGWNGIKNYSLYDDKIEGANFGVYEREQPDISLVNDVERVLIEMNGESYIYQYGEKTSNSGDVENMLSDSSEENKAKGQSAASVKFESNTNYTSEDSEKRYKREIHGEHVKIKQEEQNDREGEEDPFKITVYYRTTVRNDSTKLTLQNIEVVTHYDKDYDAGSYKDRSGEFSDSNATVNWGEKSLISPNVASGGSPIGYNNAFGLINSEPLAPGDSVTFYTSYSASRNTFMDLVDSKDQDHVFMNNNIEVNSYTTTRADTERPETGPAYAGVDRDSAAGNSNPNSVEETYEDDNDEGPTLEISLSEIRRLSGNVFEDIVDVTDPGTRESLNDYVGNGKNDHGNEEGISGVKVELVELDAKGDEILDPNGNTKVELYDWTSDNPEIKLAMTYTDSDGNYSFDGFIPGEYIVKFTWGQHVVYANPDTGEEPEILQSTTKQGDTVYVQQYKNAKFDDEERYTKAIDAQNIVEDEGPDSGTKSKWYLGGSDEGKIKGYDEYQGLSNAIDDMEARRIIDNQTENIGQDHEYKGELYEAKVSEDNTKDAEGNTLILPDLENQEYIDDNNIIQAMSSRTPAFDVGIEEVDQNQEPIENKSTGKIDYAQFHVEDLDFGISKRPETDMVLEKRIERIKVTLANGTVVVDSTVDWDEEDGTNADLKGNIQNISYPKPQKTTDRTDTGTFKIEMDKEILHGALMEITYKYTVKNNSFLDYDVASEDTANAYNLTPDINRYYKYADSRSGEVQEEEVTISPTKIIDYLDNKMSYLRKPEENAPSENELWEEITEDENKRTDIITKLLYDGRFDDSNPLYKKMVDENWCNDYSKYEKYVEGVFKGNGTNNIQEQLKDYIYKAYRTILRDVTKDNVENNLEPNGYNVRDPEDYINLKAQEKYDDLKFVASKQLADTDTDLSYYNVVELAQLRKSSGAMPETTTQAQQDLMVQ